MDSVKARLRRARVEVAEKLRELEERTGGVVPMQKTFYEEQKLDLNSSKQELNIGD